MSPIRLALIATERSGFLFLSSLFLLQILTSGSYFCDAVSVISQNGFEYEGFLTNNKFSNLNWNENNSEKEETFPSISEQSINSVGINDIIVGKTFKITVYPWNNHMGRPGDMEWSDEELENKECKSVPNGWQGKVKSINTHNNCVVLYSRERCRGASRIVKVGSPSHNRLSGICFHKKSMSARPCSTQEIGIRMKPSF